MIRLPIINEVMGTNDLKKVPLTWTLSSFRNFIAKTCKISVDVS